MIPVCPAAPAGLTREIRSRNAYTTTHILVPNLSRTDDTVGRKKDRPS